MKKIELTQGFYTLVDDDDYEWLAQYNWHILIRKSTCYAIRRRCNADGPGPKLVYMHRQILDAPRGVATDHINGNGLDNRRANLRSCSVAENCAASKLYSNNSSGFKGVRFHTIGRKWQAYIGSGSRNTREYLGLYDTPEKAAAAYNIAAREHYGEFAFQNSL